MSRLPDHPAVRVDIPGRGSIEHPVIPGASACRIICRLYGNLDLPDDAIWYVTPAGNRG